MYTAVYKASVFCIVGAAKDQDEINGIYHIEHIMVYITGHL